MNRLRNFIPQTLSFSQTENESICFGICSTSSTPCFVLYHRVRDNKARLQLSYLTANQFLITAGGGKKKAGQPSLATKRAGSEQRDSKPCHFFFRWQTWGQKMLSVRKIALHRLESNRELISLDDVMRNIWKVLNCLMTTASKTFWSELVSHIYVRKVKGISLSTGIVKRISW